MSNKSLAILLVGLLWATPLFALEVQVLWERSAEQLNLQLLWGSALPERPADASGDASQDATADDAPLAPPVDGPQEVTPKVDHDPETNEVLIRFPVGIEMPSLEQALPIMEGWVEQVNLSYDTLFLKLHPDLKADLSPGEDQLALTFKNPYAGKVPLDENTLAYRLVQTRLWMRQGRVAEAMERFEDLRRRNPRSVAVMTSMVEAHLIMGNWAKALDMAEQALALDPLNEGLADLKREVLAQRGNELALGHRRRWSDGLFSEAVNWASLNLRLLEYFYLGALWEENSYDLLELRPIDATIPASATGKIARTKGYVGVDLPINVSFELSQTTQEELSGTQADLIIHDLYGQTRLSQASELPYWGVQEALLGQSVRSANRIERLLRLGPNYQAQLAYAERKYLLIGENSANTSVIEGYARRIWRNPRWLVEKVQANARIEADLSFVKETTEAAQTQLATFATAFEQHSYMLRGLLAVDWNRYVSTQGYLGYGFNRLATNAPLLGADLYWVPFRRASVSLGYSRFIDRQVTSEAYLSGRWKF